MAKKKKHTSAQKKKAAKQAAYRRSQRARKQAQEQVAAVAADQATEAPSSNPLWDEIQTKDRELADLNARLMELECDSGSNSTGEKLKKALKRTGKWEQYQSVKGQARDLEARLAELRAEYESKRAEGLSALNQAVIDLTEKPRAVNRDRVRAMLQRKKTARTALLAGLGSEVGMLAEMQRMEEELKRTKEMVGDVNNILKDLGITEESYPSSSAGVSGRGSASAAIENSKAAVVSTGPNVFNERQSAQAASDELQSAESGVQGRP